MNEKTMYKGRFMKVTEEFIDNNNWERCYLRDGVIVYAIDENKKFIMIQEKRPHESEKVRLRFVAGHMEAGLSAVENANKELQEEIGLRANKIELFFELKSSGTINNKISFVVATDLVPDPIPNPDGDVILSIERFTYDEILQMILTDKIRWSTAVLGFLRIHLLKLNIF
jgi:8-oxo-dGTP pyrophosphatase MutT (NUDIX family)